MGLHPPGCTPPGSSPQASKQGRPAHGPSPQATQAPTLLPRLAVLLPSLTGNPPLAPSTSGTQGTLPLSLTNIPLLSSSATAGPTFTLPSPSSTPLAAWVPPSRPSAAIQAGPTTPPFHLASSFSPIPGKLARKIQALEFVEMRDLLPDNIALAERLEALPSHRSPSKAPETREVGALATWVTAFATYIAIVSAAHPHRIRDMLAYMRLLVREAKKYGGTGWITYDQVFRRNRAGPDARWDQLDPSLHIAYIASQADSPATPCSICSEVDHSAEDCALSSLRPATKRAFPPATMASRDPARGGPLCPKRQLQTRTQLGYPSKRICLSWNRGKCAFPGACNFQHVCATCRGQHPAHDCTQTPPDSGFRQSRPPQSQATQPAKEGR